MAPTLTSAATRRLPSAFITTTAQRPTSGFQVSACVPGPVAVAAQKLAFAGAPGVALPPRRTESYVKGPLWTSLTSSCATWVR